MNKYIVRQPIKDINKIIFGYEVLYQVASDGFYNDYAVADALSTFLMQNSEKVFDDKISFMTFTPTMLFKNAQRMFTNKSLVVQVEDNIVVHPMAVTMLQRLKSEGYKIALNDFQFVPRYMAIVEYVDYIKINVANYKESTLENIVNVGAGLHKKSIATGIVSKELYEKAINVGFDYFQGPYVASNMATKAQKTSYLKSSFFNLVAAINKEEPDLDEIENIISMDASLSYALLKIVNSAYFALRNTTASIKQALVTIGLVQLKQWVYLLSFKNITDDGAEEFLKTSFLRASFLQKLVESNRSMGLNKNDAYMMGMFSTLDKLIDAPLMDILQEIPISDEIKAALTYKVGQYGNLYHLALSYENGDWKEITNLAEKLGIDTNNITPMYFDCIEEVDDIWKSIVSTSKSLNESEEDDEEENEKEKAAEDKEEKPSGFPQPPIQPTIESFNDEDDIASAFGVNATDFAVNNRGESAEVNNVATKSKTVAEMEKEVEEQEKRALEQQENDMIEGVLRPSAAPKKESPKPTNKRSSKTSRIMSRLK